MQQQPAGTPPSSQGSSKAVIIIVVVVGALFAVVFVVGILAALAIGGMRKYLTNAKEAEGRATVTAIANDVVRCAETESADLLDPSNPASAKGLPVTTAPVPASLDAVANKKYMSAPSDWASPGWDCIKFQMSTPQYFQYQWVRSSPTEGTVRGLCDLDGNHQPDVTFEVPVTCSTSPSWACQAGTLRETR
jgi:type II secretory pathway pseudopilin PulG